tara:strand:- start:3853 stop:4284 length:432 start_codon:yes stop_codon:yes gene_type:complete
MSFSYSTSLTANKDKVRFRIGDTDSNRPLLSDEEINAVLTDKPAVLPASIECVDAILAKIARDVDRNAAGITSSRSQAYNHYLELRKKLEREMVTESEMFVGGLSKSAKQSFEADSDFVKPSFDIGQFDNPQAGPESVTGDDC